MRTTRPSIAKGVAAGIVGGLVGSFVMNHFQAALAKLKAAPSPPRRPDRLGGHGAQQQKSQETGEEPATVNAAQAISDAVLHRRLSGREKDRAGNLLHYLFGSAVGGLYGAIAEEAPGVKAGFGILFGSVVWLTSDEIAVPMLGLAKPPRKYPLSTHLSALAAHHVYGAATELTRRVVRKTSS